MNMHSGTRHVVVIGGAGGIGHAIATRFAQEGCAIYLLGRTLERLQRAATSLAEHGGAQVVALECDLARPESIGEALAAVPHIDVLVNAAGSIARRSLLDTVPDDWRGPWSDKVLGAVESCRVACARMRDSGGGVVVNIIGTAGTRPNPKTIMTATANATLIAFTQALGAQSVDWGVRVVGVNPGLTATARTADLSAGKGADAYQSMLADLPFKRMARPEEVADCVWFLASDAARYISATVVDVDAGARWRV